MVRGAIKIYAAIQSFFCLGDALCFGVPFFIFFHPFSLTCFLSVASVSDYFARRASASSFRLVQASARDISPV